MRGRNTTCITIRLEDTIVKSLQERALKQGFATAGEYVKAQILKSLSHSEITITPRQVLSPVTRVTKVIPYSKEAQLSIKATKRQG